MVGVAGGVALGANAVRVAFRAGSAVRSGWKETSCGGAISERARMTAWSNLHAMDARVVGTTTRIRAINRRNTPIPINIFLSMKKIITRFHFDTRQSEIWIKNLLTILQEVGVSWNFLDLRE
jgi:hypothetical protein